MEDNVVLEFPNVAAVVASFAKGAYFDLFP
jgi:hypothetical protein